LGKILEFKKSERYILEEMKKDARKELQQLYYFTGGFRFPLPPIFDEEEMQSFYDGILEF